MTEVVSESRSESGVDDSSALVAPEPQSTDVPPEETPILEDNTAEIPEPQTDTPQPELIKEEPPEHEIAKDAGDATGSGDEPQGIMNEVRQRTSKRRRRRGVPPGWTIWLAKQSEKGRTFFSHQLPAWMMSNREQLISYLTSFAVLSFICMLMALWVMPPVSTEELFSIIAGPIEPKPEGPLVVEVESTQQPEDITELNLNSTMKELLADDNDGQENFELDMDERQMTLELDASDLDIERMFRKGEFGGRSTTGKRTAIQKYGGSAESERAVNIGLQWLKKTQQKDGSWHFGKVGDGADPGGYRRTEVGSTSMALLCFLGAGHTHKKPGPYKDTVFKGLKYIGSQVQEVSGGADLRGVIDGRNPGMYVQGLATICVSEAYALERRDKDLRKVSDMAVSFIERAQDPFGGGWRYSPRDPGDTSVVGWQVMALQSARAGGIRVSSKTLRNVREYLQDAQGDSDGSTYKYTPDAGGASNTMSAVGLLCRMYMGWRKDHKGLEKGVNRLSAVGPSKNNMYYNYYATQVLHHWGGDLWKKWNLKMREQLIRTQITEGPAKGSWKPTDNHGRTAGQIYQTALCILTLEVYYRHLPMYQELDKSVKTATTSTEK